MTGFENNAGVIEWTDAHDALNYLREHEFDFPFQIKLIEEGKVNSVCPCDRLEVAERYLRLSDKLEHFVITTTRIPLLAP